MEVLWLCIAPLGRPVVPEVYMMKRRSSSPALLTIGAEDEALIMSS